MKRHFRFWLVGLTALLLVFGGVACSSGAEVTNQGAEEKVGNQTDSYPVKVKDDTGTEVTVEKEPKRIVSLIPSMTETVYALDLGNRVVGVTSNDNYPKEATKVKKVGDMKINAEKVVALKPDLVVASPMNGEDTLKKLRDMGLTVIAYDPQNVEAVYEQIETMGKVTNRDQKATEVVEKMKKEQKLAKDIAAKVKKEDQVKVWLEVSPDLFTGGEGTFMDELITLAGGDNVAQNEKGWAQVSEEKVVKWNPDVVLYTHGDENAIQSRKAWKQVNALTESRVESLDTDKVSRPGPRITQGLLDISQALYPDIYEKAVQ